MLKSHSIEVGTIEYSHPLPVCESGDGILIVLNVLKRFVMGISLTELDFFPLQTLNFNWQTVSTFFCYDEGLKMFKSIKTRRKIETSPDLY